MTTQCRIRKRAVTIHPERRSKQQHLRHNNIFILSLMFCCFCLGFVFLSLLFGIEYVVYIYQLYQYIFDVVVVLVCIQSGILLVVCSIVGSSISQKIGMQLFFCAIFLVVGKYFLLTQVAFYRQQQSNTQIVVLRTTDFLILYFLL